MNKFSGHFSYSDWGTSKSRFLKQVRVLQPSEIGASAVCSFHISDQIYFIRAYLELFEGCGSSSRLLSRPNINGCWNLVFVFHHLKFTVLYFANCTVPRYPVLDHLLYIRESFTCECCDGAISSLTLNCPKKLESFAHPRSAISKLYFSSRHPRQKYNTGRWMKKK